MQIIIYAISEKGEGRVFEIVREPVGGDPIELPLDLFNEDVVLSIVLEKNNN
jgi:hypothetical protein